MKICVVVKNSIWYDPRVKKQLIEYTERGYTTECVGIYDTRYDKKEEDLLPCKVSLGKQPLIKRKNILSKAYWEYKTNQAMYRLIVKSHPDIIHANDLNGLIPAYKAARKLKCRIIYDTHEIFLENLWIARNKIMKTIYGYYEKRIIKNVDLVLCVSNAAKEYLKAQYHLNDIVVVTNSIPLKEIANITIEEKSMSFDILNHGQYYEGRGYDLMLMSAKLLQDSGLTQITFVLRGFGVLEQELRSYVENNKLYNVRFDPPVKTYELISYASKSHIGLAITEPSCINFKLSVSNKLFEYAAAGLPVIMSKIPEHIYLNEAYKFGIVLENNSPECLAAAVERLFTDSSFYETCATNARAFSKDICWEKEFDKVTSSKVFVDHSDKKLEVREIVNAKKI